MGIRVEEVDHIAQLARLALTESERVALCEQLSTILSYMEKLNAIDTAGVDQTTSVLQETQVLREDVCRPSLSQGEALQGAPDTADGFFRVPKILSYR